MLGMHDAYARAYMNMWVHETFHVLARDRQLRVLIQQGPASCEVPELSHGVLHNYSDLQVQHMSYVQIREVAA